ncbi:MAG: TlpA family protein disulfide reductase [Acidimicrobiia bacterium]
MPVVDRVSVEYADRVTFLAPAWKGTFPATEQRARELFVSGVVRWGLDTDETVFEAFGVPYQPQTVLIAADGTIFATWAGARDEASIREALDALVSDSA